MTRLAGQVRLLCCAWIVLVACGDGGSKLVLLDAADDAAVVDASVFLDAAVCAVSAGQLDCAQTCGNSQVDDCWNAGYSHGICTTWHVPESCDGVVTCVDRGYYGVTNVCESCQFRDSSCEVCNAGDIACATVDYFRLGAMSASGPRLGLVEEGGGTGPGARIWVVNGTTKIAELWPTSRAQAIVGLANGWLVATSSPPTVFSVSATGVAGPAYAIDTAEPAMAFASARVIIAWSEYSTSWNAKFAIVNTNGQNVVGQTLLFSANGDRPGVASDGTSFFVGSRGSLAKVATNGTFSVTTGFPTGNYAQVTWSGTTGWYIARGLNGYVAQRFDTTGAAIGTPVTIGVAEDFLADGIDLLVLRYVGTKLMLVRIDATGATLGSIEVGAGGDPTSAGGGAARVARVSGSLYVAWSWYSKLRIAQVAAP